MPLRLTGSTLAQSAPTSASDSSALPADSLARHARGLLARGDVDGYRGLLRDTHARQDRQRRIEALLAAVDAGLRFTMDAGEASAARAFAAIADALLDELEREPSEPLLLNLAGVACYELWALDGAGALFEAALRLQDTLADARGNLRQLALRRRAARGRRRPLHASVPALTRRARQVAGRARPASGLTLSLCMIVRDEEQMLGRCLESAAPAVDEIVVVDTGSRDRTIEIARSFGARVIEREWTGSFADARNASFEAATGDWIVYLDADEVLEGEDVGRLRALTSQTWHEAFYLVETSWLGEDGEGAAMVNNALRVFRNRPAYRFSGRLHEQILHTLPTFVPGRIQHSSVRITHHGYLGSVRAAREKSARNLELLRRQAQESAPSAFLHFNLGSEYAAAGDHHTAAVELYAARAMLLADESLADCHFAPVLLARLVTSLRLAGRLFEARNIAAEAIAMFPQLTDIVLEQARIAHARGEHDEAIALYRRCMEMGDAPARLGALIGAGTFLPRLALAQLHLQRGEPAHARGLLSWCVEHHPGFLAVAGPYASALVRDGASPEQAMQQIGRLRSLPGTVRIAVAAAFAAAGQRRAAIEQYQLGLRDAPGDHRARAALAELLLAAGEWEQAAEQARLVPAQDPAGPRACRIQLLASIGREPAESVRLGLERAREAGVPAAELEVLEAWAELGTLKARTTDLPLGGTPMLVVALETLLRGGDAERFAALLPLLERTPLPERERRETLARMYLANGLLAQAAREWMAAAAPQPDARALLGLALVAERHGLAEDARNLATGALELDGGCQPARELLARVGAGEVTRAA
ncbi:MAG TPA: glycosyltransferase [Solirubrobacteraceae bacterium]|nr:glycosyltransferase [Solirubrobacteraceae bacterium]